MQTLGVLDVNGLDVGVQALLGTLLVVTLARDADAQAEGNTLDTGFPDLLVELGVEADVLGALNARSRGQLCASRERERLRSKTYHGLLGKGADLLDGTGSTLLEADTVAL